MPGSKKSAKGSPKPAKPCAAKAVSALVVPRPVVQKVEMVRRCLPQKERDNLYELFQPLFDKDTRRRLGFRVPCCFYLEDPYVAQEIPELGLQEVEVGWEPALTDGPTSSRLAVVDYDADRGVLTAPAHWDEKRWTFVDPEDRPVSENPDSFQFHQVSLWATVQSILEFYEDPWVLGRPVPWGFEGNRLILVPHAGYAENAFYDRHSKSLQLYYYGSPAQYTCLSHDIIAHETGHAILDGIRPHYYEDSSLQTGAFHEYLADLTAILTALRNVDVRDLLAKVEAVQDKDAIDDLLKHFVGYLAPGFGVYAKQRPYLRSAYNKKTMAEIDEESSPHDCSEILTGTMFEILQRLAADYRARHATEKQIWWRVIDRFRRIALQALDYCPPADVQFLDYARAVLHCYALTSPRDTHGYGDMMLEIFHERGFCNCAVWRQKDHKRGECALDPPAVPDGLLHHDIERIAGSREGAYRFLDDNREKLGIPARQDILIADLYRTSKWDVGREKLPGEVVVEYLWREPVELNDDCGELRGRTVHLLCGGTLVFHDNGNLVSWFPKPGSEDEVGARRRSDLLAHVAGKVRSGTLGLLTADEIDQLGLLAPPVVAREVDGALRLEATPNLRDRELESEETQGFGGERWTTSF